MGSDSVLRGVRRRRRRRRRHRRYRRYPSVSLVLFLRGRGGVLGRRALG